MASGVFGLKKVYKKQVENVDNSNFASWPENADTGYYAGGHPISGFPSIASRIYKLDFSTASLSTNPIVSPVATYRACDINAPTCAYFTHGVLNLSLVRKLDYTTDAESLPGNDSTYNLQSGTGTQSNYYGYICGGFSPGPVTPATAISSISKMDYNGDVLTVPGANLPEGIQAMGNPGTTDQYSYMMGGVLASGSFTNLTQRLDFSSDTCSLPGNNLPSTYKDTRTINTANYSFVVANTGPAPTYDPHSTIKRLDFSTETIAVPGTNTVAKKYFATVTDGSTGYFGGGYVPTPTPPGINSNFHTIDLLTESVSSSPITFFDGLEEHSSTSGGASTGRSNGYKDVGYFMGGYDGGNSSYVKRMDFTSDTSSTPSMRISHATTGMYGVANNNFGYAMGGYHGQGTSPPSTGDNYESRLHRIDFATENLTVFSATPEAHTNYTTLWGVDDMYGWKAGDIFNAPPSPIGSRSDIRRLDYSTESWNVPGTVQPTRQAQGLVFSDVKNRNGISIAGWGYTPTVNYLPQRLLKYQTTNDTITQTTPYVDLGVHKRYTSNVSTPQYGYMSGGEEPGAPAAVSNVLRFDFSSDVMIDTSANSHPHQRGTGVSSNYYGYFCQGGPASPPPFALATITKFDYSTETASPAPNMNGGGDHNLGSMSNGI